MKIKIFQINSDRDKNRVKFCGLQETEQHQGSSQIDPSLYNEVFSGEVDCRNLEGVFTLFNTDHPPFHRGHSLSISDVVQVDGYSPEFVGVVHYQHTSDFCEDMVFTDRDKFDEAAKETVEDYGVPVTSEILRNIKPPDEKDGFYFCDRIGFDQIEFDPTLAQKPDGLLRVVAVEPGRPAYEAQLADNLRNFQQAVRGRIEVTYPFKGNAVAVSNAVSKIEGLSGNRTINGETYAGTMFIIGDKGNGTFCSLTDDQVRQYLAEFDKPEFFDDEGMDESMDSGINMT